MGLLYEGLYSYIDKCIIFKKTLTYITFSHMFKHLSHHDITASIPSWKKFVSNVFSQEITASSKSPLVVARHSFRGLKGCKSLDVRLGPCARWSRTSKVWDLMAKYTLHWFLPHQDRCHGVTVGQMLKLWQKQCEKAMFVRIKSFKYEFLFPYFLTPLYLISFLHHFYSHPFLMHMDIHRTVFYIKTIKIEWTAGTQKTTETCMTNTDLVCNVVITVSSEQRRIKFKTSTK